MRTARIATGLLALLAGIAAGPIAAAAASSERVERFRFTDGPSTNVFEPCGAIETVTVTVHGADYYDAGGGWVRSLVHFAYDSVVTGPTGRTIRLDAHQNARFTPQGINTLTGQGANVRAPGHGLLYQDVGRLVFDESVPFPGQTLFASAKAVSFEAFDPDKLAAAVRAAVG
jgi:hypothetical protein